jgi:hypothetical protein
MVEYFRGSKIVYIRKSPFVWIGKSLYALCRLCGEPVDDRQKRSARLHKKCAVQMVALYRKRYERKRCGS